MTLIVDTYTYIYRVLTGQQRAKKAEETQKTLFIVNQDSKFVDNQIQRATERQRVESKEQKKYIEHGERFRSEIDRVKK